MAPKNSRASHLVEYHEGKFWFHREGNILTLGITERGLELLGEAEKLHLPQEGDDFEADDVIIEIDGTDGGLQVISPAEGYVTEVNKSVSSDVAVLNEDPVDEGWLVKIEIQNDTGLKEYL